ncbi:MAG: hypothetical protein J7K69_01120 [Thermotogae bacterium]|nr:hypothetical protein [Thermotogota bacterium]
MPVISMDFEDLIERLKISRQKYLKNLFSTSRDPHLKKLILKEMRKWEIEDRELLTSSLEESHPAILVETLRYCYKLSIPLTNKIYESFIDSKDDNIRAALVLYSERVLPWLTIEEIKEFLTDHSPKVRKAAIKRLKDQLELRELRVFVDDPSISVKNEALKLIIEKSNDIREIIWVFQHSNSQRSTLKKALKKVAILSKDYLLDLLKSEKRENIEVLIIEALKDSPCWKLKEILLPYLEKKKEDTQLIAKIIFSLSFSCKGDEEIFKKLELFLDSKSSLLRKNTLRALRRLSKENINVKKILEMLDDPDPEVSKEALNTLSLLGVKDVERQISLFLSSKDDSMRKTALVAVKRLKLKEFEGILLNIVRADENLEMKKAALRGLYAIKSQSLEEVIRDILLLPMINFELKYLAARMAIRSYPSLVTQL